VVLAKTKDIPGSAQLKPAAFRQGDELPNPLPPGAHRVISEMTAAQMRKMMEGVVLYGTGRPAQLDGYSAGGKTGTAQKIDPKTHTYSKTKYVASFVGFAPVNNPAVTIAVIMDSPTKGSHFGTAVSAPVFHDLAQQVLEYLGVPHDQDLKPVKEIAKSKAPVVDDVPEDTTADLQSLFAEVNHLPADDPLSSSAPPAAPVADDSGAPADAAQVAQAAPVTSSPQSPPPPTFLAHLLPAVVSPHPPKGSVSVATQQVAVPSFAGKSLREVVVQASAAGLGVHVVGSGVARDQAPAAGTMVPAGTDIVVQFGR
jgi:cell division protein FtsI (penicillin-binding protein 3)